MISPLYTIISIYLLISIDPGFAIWYRPRVSIVGNMGNVQPMAGNFWTRCRGVGVRTYWLGGSICKGKDITIWQQAISRSWGVYESGVKITLNVGLSKPFCFFQGFLTLLILLMGFLSAKNCPLLRWARTQVSERHDFGYIGA